MKYVVMVGDGMGDRPIAQLNWRTVLESARTPHMDHLARTGRLGLAETIPPGFEPGSDVANMSLMGFDPGQYHTGRSPIEAAAMGVDLGPDEIAFRCNLVNLDRGGNHIIMQDYASGHIGDGEAKQLVQALDTALGGGAVKFHPGVSYRHLVVWKQGPLHARTVPPHNHTGQPVEEFLARRGETQEVNNLVKKSWPLLENQPVNLKRMEQGLIPANSIWLWGQGIKPQVPSLQERFGLTGFTVTAVDLVKGLGVLAGMANIPVKGATGYLDTNYAGKVEAVLSGLARYDLAFLHVEAPDEAGHGGNLADKLRAIEDFDAMVVGPLLHGLPNLGPHRVLLAFDHCTPLETQTHSDEPISYVLWDSGKKQDGAPAYNEKAAQKLTQGQAAPGHRLLRELIVPQDFDGKQHE